MEEFLEELKKDFQIDERQTLWYKGYADDLVFIVKAIHLEKFMDSIHKISLEFNLKINPKKSNIMAIKGHKHYDEFLNITKLRGIEIKDKYLYLGVWINNKG